MELQEDIRFRRERGAAMGEETLFSKKIITRSKAFFLDFKKNDNGKFLKVTESTGDKRSFVFVPEEGLKEFSETLAEIVDQHMEQLP